MYVYTRSGSSFTAAAPIALGHFAPGATGSARNKGVGLSVQPNASGMGISADGQTLVVANNYNDSISVIDTATRTVRYEHDLRPFFANNEGTNGGAGGTFPFAVVVKGNGTAYVSSDRDREVVVVDVSVADRRPPDQAHQARRQRARDDARRHRSPGSMWRRTTPTRSRSSTRRPTGSSPRSMRGRRPACCPAAKYTGAATFAVTLSPDGQHAVRGQQRRELDRRDPADGPTRRTRVSGLIPTAYEPHDITFSADGSWMYIISGKSVTGPNPGHLASSTASITSITYPGGNAAAAAACASVEPVPVPVGARVAGQRAGAGLAAICET